jgi:hypothetical protein
MQTVANHAMAVSKVFRACVRLQKMIFKPRNRLRSPIQNKTIGGETMQPQPIDGGQTLFVEREIFPLGFGLQISDGFQAIAFVFTVSCYMRAKYAMQ